MALTETIAVSNLQGSVTQPHTRKQTLPQTILTSEVVDKHWAALQHSQGFQFNQMIQLMESTHQ